MDSKDFLSAAALTPDMLAEILSKLDGLDGVDAVELMAWALDGPENLEQPE